MALAVPQLQHGYPSNPRLSGWRPPLLIGTSVSQSQRVWRKKISRWHSTTCAKTTVYCGGQPVCIPADVLYQNLQHVNALLPIRTSPQHEAWKMNPSTPRPPIREPIHGGTCAGAICASVTVPADCRLRRLSTSRRSSSSPGRRQPVPSTQPRAWQELKIPSLY